MFTGVHPGDHRFVSLESSGHPIHPDLTTLSELLSRHGYKCSALVSHGRLIPEYGFGRGFHRYRVNNMRDWITRENDASENVNQVVDWIEQDVTSGHHGLFYFLHVMDPHFPYYPPLPNSNVSSLDFAPVAAWRTLDAGGDYLRFVEDGPHLDESYVETLRSYYRESVRYTADQLARLFYHLEHRGILRDALIVVTGDHGEEFGERGFYGHNSLYDANIRPFMIVKPPADAGWTVPDEADTIDIVPTIARCIDVPVPDQCQGRAWQDVGPDDPPRITERIRPDWYNVAVEVEGVKGIFTYRENYPDRPTSTMLSAGPVHEEYHRMDAISRGDFTPGGGDVSDQLKKGLRDRARSFAGSRPITMRLSRTPTVGSAPDVEEQLKYLGYR